MTRPAAAFALGALALLAIGGAFFALRGGDSASRSSGVGDQATGPSTRAEQDAAVVEHVDEAPSIDEHAIAPESSLRESAAATAVAAEQSIVRVVDDTHGAPISGATVLWFDAQREKAARVVVAEDGDVELHGSTHALVFRTDAAGETRVPRVSRGVVFASTDSLRGSTRWTPKHDGPIVVRLDPDTRTWVRVRTPDGAPVAELPLVLFRPWNEHGEDERSEEARTNAAGLACFQEYRHPSNRASVAVDIVGASTTKLAVTGSTSREHPLELVLPPCVSLRVRVTLNGALMSDARGKVQVYDVAEGRPLEPDPRRAVLLSDGAARVPRVGVGANVLAVVSLERVVGDLQGEVQLAPGVPEPVLDVELAKSTSIVLRLVDARGEAVRDGRVRVRIGVDDGVGLARDVRLVGGVVRVVTDGAAVERRVLRVLVEGSGEAVVDLSRALAPGVNDLGDVALGSGPCIASGRVVDEAGAPVARARVTVKAAHGTVLDGSVHAAAYECESESASDGSFRVLGIAPEAPLEISASRRGWNGDKPREIAVGAADVQLVLKQGGKIEGSVQAPVESDLTRFEVRALLVESTSLDSGDRRSGRRPVKTNVRSNGTFTFDTLPEGTWEVVVMTRTLVAVGRRESVRVQAGETTKLEPISLDAGVRVVKLEIVDDAAAPLADAWCYAIDGERRTRITQRQGDRRAPGVFGLDVPTSGIDVVVVCPTRRSVLLERVASDQRVVLAPAQPVRVVVTGDVALSDDEYMTVAVFIPRIRELAGAVDKIEPLSFTDERESEFDSTTVGVHDIVWGVWNLEGRGGGPEFGDHFGALGSTTVTIPSAATRATVEISPPRGGVRALREKLAAEQTR